MSLSVPEHTSAPPSPFSPTLSCYIDDDVDAVEMQTEGGNGDETVAALEAVASAAGDNEEEETKLIDGCGGEQSIILPKNGQVT
jgi:hypothetical protein